MKQTAILFFVLFMFGCQKASGKIEQDIITKPGTNPQEEITVQNPEVNCEEFFRQVVLSSNLSAVKNYKDIFVRIESSSEDKIVLELYVNNNLSESSQSKQTVENAIAWLNFLPASEKLYDITADPEEPIEINFNKALLENYDFRKTCGLNPKKSDDKLSNTAKTNCKEIKGDMLSGEECLISSKSLDDVYKDMVDHSAVKDAEFLLKKLPKINTSEKINKNGIIEIAYKVKQNEVLIEMLYAGGVTDIELKKQNESVKRKIVYNAD
jgi:hypothetical protein